MDSLFFDTWESLFRTAFIALFSYLSLLAMLRIAGNRMLSQLNAFDLIITVALGSTLATTILTKNVPLADGLLGFSILIALQWTISKLSFRFRTFQKVLKSEPKLLYFKGRYLEKELKECHVTEEEILQVIRATGITRLEDVEAVVLETNGKFSVLRKTGSTARSVLKNVKGFDSNAETSR
jgi:uncharacterized membrane protein YcaP (DUF421 family)